MKVLIIVFKSIIIGFLLGGAVSAGAARMFHAPETQGLGAFRTLGELNACNGDPVAHFSFGFGFLLNSAAATVGAGALTQDVVHRVIPNFATAILLLRNKKIEETLYNPSKMALAGAVVGAVVVTFLNTLSAIVPHNLAEIAAKILTPASNLMINPVMPVIFWLAALDAGKTTGTWATVLGGFSHMVSGNATPGVVLGILVGQTVEENGYKSKPSIGLILIVVIMFIAIAYFRGFFKKLGLNF